MEESIGAGTNEDPVIHMAAPANRSMIAMPREDATTEPMLDSGQRTIQSPLADPRFIWTVRGVGYSLIDDGARVSGDYGMVGVYGHADRPSHSFAPVRQDGSIGWVRHYAEMFVPSDTLFSELDSAIGS